MVMFMMKMELLRSIGGKTRFASFMRRCRRSLARGFASEASPVTGQVEHGSTDLSRAVHVTVALAAW